MPIFQESTNRLQILVADMELNALNQVWVIVVALRGRR